MCIRDRAKDEGIMQRLGRFTDPESKATLSPTAVFLSLRHIS